MRIFLATIGTEPHNATQKEVFVALAAADAAGVHQLETDPDRADAVLFVDLQQHPGDPLLRALRTHDLVQAHRGKVYVYDERDFPVYTLPGIYVGGTDRARRKRPWVGGPYPVLPNPLEPSRREPELLYSFQGSRTHPVRDAILALDHPRGYVEDTTGINFLPWVEGERSADAAGPRPPYGEVIARSKFVLCPRGHGTSSFRLYETLAAGRVPVVLSDRWLAPPRVDWAACTVRVPERDASRLPDILARAEARWPELVDGGRAAVASEFGRDRLWHHYAESICALQHHARGTPRPWWMQSEVVRLGARRLRARAHGLRNRRSQD